MKIIEHPPLDEKVKGYSVLFDEDESVEILAFKKNRVNLIVKKE